MTNHWSDIANATCVIAWGANPSENHPACMAHINRARFPGQFFPAPDTRANKKPATLIVIDPRKTRTALQADRYIRIRPGTDIALINGLARYMIAKIEALAPADPVRVAFFSRLNQNGAGTFFFDNGGAAAGAVVATGAAGGNSKYTDARFLVNAAGTDYQRAIIDAASGAIVGAAGTGTVTNFPLKAATVDADPNTVYNRFKAHVDPYTTAVVADICGCSEGDIAFVGDAFIANSLCTNGVLASGSPSVTDARDPNYRVTTLLYAMGITQHTCGSQNIKGFANLQTLMGNQGRAGGGINALRGIHNVQGSTDMGLLNGNIPAYSGNPGTQVTAIPDTGNQFGKYMDGLWGNPLSGTGTRTTMNSSYDDAYVPAAMNLQQRGFFNMTLKWFGDFGSMSAGGAANRTKIDAAFSLWPKGNGDDHISMFRAMKAGTTTALVAWGQNPAVTEPNQSYIRDGLYNLDTLVCVDMFETETAAAKRKPGSVTFLIPTAAHIEKAGSATNSGRTLQWRYKAIDPSGNTKDDSELLLRLAKALDVAGAFSHIKSVWDTYGISYTTDVYTQLYANPYGGYTGAGTGFSALQGTGELVNPRTVPNDAQPTYDTTANNLKGSEWVAETVYREMCTPIAGGGTMWIYTGAYNATATWTTDNIPAAYAPWLVQNRAKSRDRRDPAGQLAFHGWGYSWLVNRRVFYNNSDVPGDVADFYMEPDSCSRLFVCSAPPALLNYSRWYRKYHGLADKPSPVVAGDTTSPHYVMDTQAIPAKISYAGKFPAHTEPYETPRQDVLITDKWGRNTKGGSAWDLVKTDTVVAGRDVAVAGFPFVLTTIRCVEHFQGGPITRNNPYNVEQEPEPWIEINSADARAKGIKDGDWVNITTARGDSTTGQQARTNYTASGSVTDNFGKGFRARVGTGTQDNQRVGQGVVAIPWHWGDRGLSTGSRANDLCIDAGDANSVIPEYKACLCNIEKA